MSAALQPPGRARRRGFTLLEILLAITVAAMLMVAAMTLVLSMGELWGRGSESRVFERHVRGVTRFLESLALQARPAGELTPKAAATDTARNGTNTNRNRGRAATDPRTGAPVGANAPAAANAAGGTDADAEDRFIFGNPVGYEGAPPMLMFDLDEAPGICVWPRRPLPRVSCALQITPEEGLSLLWKSRLEEDFEQSRPRKTLISPYVQGVQFEYFDEDRGEWTRLDGPIIDPGNVPRVPQRLRLRFVYGTLTRDVSVALPALAQGAPLR